MRPLSLKRKWKNYRTIFVITLIVCGCFIFFLDDYIEDKQEFDSNNNNTIFQKVSNTLRELPKSLKPLPELPHPKIVIPWRKRLKLDTDPEGYVETPDPMIHVITYADKCCFNRIKEFCKGIQDIGKVNTCQIANLEWLDQAFRAKNEYILSQHRGAGYWLWKSYIILKKLKDPSVRWGDFVLYMDIGSSLIGDATILSREANRQKKHFLLFSSVFIPNFKFVKRDAFVMMGCDEPKCYNAMQLDAARSFWRKTNISIQLVEEWNYWAQNSSVLTDDPSKNPNLDGFQDHRHDQSVISLLQVIHDIETHNDISQNTMELKDQWNQGHHNNSPWDKIVDHHRNKS